MVLLGKSSYRLYHTAAGLYLHGFLTRMVWNAEIGEVVGEPLDKTGVGILESHSFTQFISLVYRGIGTLNII